MFLFFIVEKGRGLILKIFDIAQNCFPFFYASPNIIEGLAKESMDQGTTLSVHDFADRESFR